MIHIDPQEVEQAVTLLHWEETAQKARDATQSAQEDRRTVTINGHRAVWGGLKLRLQGIHKGKCWYCESVQERSDNDIDHYRPKGRVIECPKHNGYWWLAFTWENYRFCCSFCNTIHGRRDEGTQGGKNDHFPLWDESRRAYCPTDDIDAEQPLLLDPFKAADPPLLWFDEDGRAAPNPKHCRQKDDYPSKRVLTSIHLYNLNEGRLVERREALCRMIKRRVRRAEAHWRRFLGGDTTAEDAVSEFVMQIRAMKSCDAEYSATANAVLCGLRGSFDVVDVVLAE